MSTNKMPLLSDPFDATKILINTVIDKLEQTYPLLSSEQFSTQVEKIDKDIKLLASCVVKTLDNQEKARRSVCIKSLEQRVNNIRTLFLTRTVKSGQVADSTFTTSSTTNPVTNSDTQQLLVKQMINQQDEQLEQIAKSVGNLKQMANTIGDELKQSNQIIDEIAIKVDEVDGRLNYTTRGIKRLNQKMKNSCCCKTGMIIGAIVIIFVVVLVCIL